MIKKIFASVLIIFYILCLPLYSYSSTLTYNGFMKLTSSGAAKVAAASPVIARGLWAAGAYKIIPYAGMVIAVGMMVYSTYQKIKELTVVNVSVPAVSPSASPIPVPAGSYGKVGMWGTQGASGTEYITHDWRHTSEAGFTCASGYPASIKTTNTNLPYNMFAVGGYQFISTVACTAEVRWTFSETTYVYAMLFPSLPPLPVGVPTADLIPAWWPSENWPDDPAAVRAGVEQELAAARAIAEAAVAASPENVPFHQPLLIKIIAAQDALKSISLEPSDYTTTGVAPVENTYPSDVEVPSFPSEIPPIEDPPVEDVPPVPNDACSYYQRAKHFDYSSLLQSAQAIPLLGLLSKLVINPAAGQFNGKVNFQLSKFGAQEIDLNKWHYSDVIAIFRFVIIGGAFLTAIRIIYD